MINPVQMADMTFDLLNRRMPFDLQKRPRWKVTYEDPETGEEKEVIILSKHGVADSRIITYVESEYGPYVSMQRVS